jgi:predicted dehydrogenase
VEKKLGVALVGCGSVARWKYAENLRRMEGVSLRAFYGGQAEEFRRTYGDCGAAACASLAELLARPDVDAVCVCTPNSAHAPVALAALRAGKHVLCEKPMATSLADGEAMVQAARRSGVLLTVGHQARFLPAAQALHAEIRQGALGEIEFVRASMLRRLGIPTWGHFFDPAVQGGGCLMDLGTHAIDLALWLAGSFDAAYCSCGAFRGPADLPSSANRYGVWDPAALRVETSAFGQIVLSSGTVVSVDTSWALHIPADAENRTLLCGTRGGAELTEGGYTRVATTPDALRTEFVSVPGDEDAANRAQLENFLRAIRTGGTPLVGAEESLAVLRILLGLYRSARERRPVDLKEESDHA